MPYTKYTKYTPLGKGDELDSFVSRLYRFVKIKFRIHRNGFSVKSPKLTIVHHISNRFKLIFSIFNIYLPINDLKDVRKFSDKCHVTKSWHFCVVLVYHFSLCMSMVSSLSENYLSNETLFYTDFSYNHGQVTKWYNVWQMHNHIWFMH